LFNFLSSLLIVNAQTEEIEPTEVKLPEVGIAPNSPFYRLDIWMDKLTIMATINNEKRISKLMKIADERLAEIKQMGIEGNEELVIKAQEQHDKLIEKLKEESNNIETEIAEEKVKLQMEIQRRIHLHSEKVAAVKSKIIESMILKERNPEKIVRLEQRFNLIIDQSKQIEDYVNLKTENLKNTISQQTGKTIEEVSDSLETEIILIENKISSTEIEYSGVEILPIEKDNQFCGTSSFGICTQNSDCETNGCSNEICGLSGDELTPTICRYSPCFDKIEFEVECGCKEGMCQWTKKEELI